MAGVGSYPLLAVFFVTLFGAVGAAGGSCQRAAGLRIGHWRAGKGRHHVSRRLHSWCDSQHRLSVASLTLLNCFCANGVVRVHRCDLFWTVSDPDMAAFTATVSKPLVLMSALWRVLSGGSGSRRSPSENFPGPKTGFSTSGFLPHYCEVGFRATVLLTKEAFSMTGTARKPFDACEKHLSAMSRFDWTLSI